MRLFEIQANLIEYLAVFFKLHKTAAEIAAGEKKRQMQHEYWNIFISLITTHDFNDFINGT